MNGLIVSFFAVLAVVSAAPSGHLGGAVITGPAGIVTGHGAIGPVGHGLGLGLGLGHGGAVLAAPSAAAVVSGPALGAVVAGPAVGLGVGLGHGLAWGHGLGAVTAGGGTVSATAHGAAIRGPPTSPVVVSGPSGKIAADGLWGPTANVGLTGGHGGWAHGGWGHHGHW